MFSRSFAGHNNAAQTSTEEGRQLTGDGTGRSLLFGDAGLDNCLRGTERECSQKFSLVARNRSITQPDFF